jgi:gluconokinase
MKAVADAGLVLVFDIGTSSLRTALFTSAGERLLETTAQAAYPLHTTADSGAEASPSILKSTAENCLRKTLQVYRENHSLRDAPIIAIGGGCFWHSLLGVDENNLPLTPIITWADSRCRGEAAQLREEMSERAVHKRTGCMLRTSFWPAKLLWLRRTQPAIVDKVYLWMSPAEWLWREFAGEKATCGLSMASGTGLLNAHTLEWDEAILARCAMAPEKLLPLSDEPQLAPQGHFGDFPELRGVPWFPALGDGAASNLGCGATNPGVVAINVGTSAAVRTVRESGPASAPFGLFCYRVDAKRQLIGGASSNAGNLRAWCLRELRLSDDPVLIEEALARRQTPEHGLTVLSSWNAERAPDWSEDPCGVIHGVTHHTTALDLLQAIVEASYFRIAKIVDMIFAQHAAEPQLIISGGIQRSPSSLQRLADVLNQPLYPNDEPEATLKGAAVYALEKLGVNVPQVALTQIIRPNPSAAGPYAAARQRQRKLAEHFEAWPI